MELITLAEYNSDERKILLQTAKDSVIYGLNHPNPPELDLHNYSPHLLEHRSCFVTLRMHEHLRGCIGSLQASQPLIMDVVANAFNAAFDDPRFKPVKAHELDHLVIDISVLSKPITMQVKTEADLLQQLRPGVDGLILSDHGHRATFLPSVWDQLPNPADFVSQLKNKAGWNSDYWSNTLKIETYTAELIS